MKYGLNFGHKEIPEDRMGLKKRIRVAFPDGWYWLTLEGIATTEDDKNELVIQADNGHRKIHTTFKRQPVTGLMVHGVYLS